jgi:protein archease
MIEIMPFELEGRGADVGLRVTGPDLGDCLRAAVAGFAAVFAEVDPGVPRERAEVRVPGSDPAELLVTLMDELILRLDDDGLIAIDLLDAVVSDGALRGVLLVVPVAAAQMVGAGPKAATWHDVRLGPADGGGWEGYVLLDL